jgi:hypothetical protein
VVDRAVSDGLKKLVPTQGAVARATYDHPDPRIRYQSPTRATEEGRNEHEEYKMSLVVQTDALVDP